MKNNKNLSRIVIYVVKILLTSLILFFIFRKVDFSNVLHDFSKISVATLLILIITTIIKLSIQYSNWKKYLTLNPEYKSGRHEIMKSYFIGMALHFLLPAGIGFFGKMFFVNNKKSATAFSVGVERIFITWKNVFFASLAAIFYFQNVSKLFTIPICIIIFFVPLIIYNISHIIANKNIKQYFNNYRKITPTIILLQIMFAFVSFFQYFILMNNFIKVSFYKILISVPLIHFSHILPISFSGFGVREVFAIEVFSKFNISPETAVTTTFTIFFINTVIPALIGLYFILTHKKVKV